MNKSLQHIQGALCVRLLVAAAALVLIAGGLAAHRQVGSGSIGAGHGPGLLYFYADW
jgi:hypothetical protein